MKTSILTTDFNFAKSILSLIAAAPDAYPSYPSGMLDFIKPYWNYRRTQSFLIT